MGRASMPSSVCSCRNVNCVGPNVKAFGFSASIAWVVGVSGREDTTRVLKPRGGPANPSTSHMPWGRNTTAVFRDSDCQAGVTQRRLQYNLEAEANRETRSLRDQVLVTTSRIVYAMSEGPSSECVARKRCQVVRSSKDLAQAAQIYH